jgi:hypothetical protein
MSRRHNAKRDTAYQAQRQARRDAAARRRNRRAKAQRDRAARFGS